MILADLNRYWKVLQMGTKTINNIVIENIYTLLTATPKWIIYFKSEGQCQGHKISFFEIVEKLEFLAILS